MRCFKCNTINDGTHRFCENCGHELEVKNKAPNKDIVWVETYEEKRKKGAKNRLFAIWFIIVALIILIILIIIINKNDSNIVIDKNIKSSKNSEINEYANIDFSIIGNEGLVVETDSNEVTLTIKTLPSAKVLVNNMSIQIDENGIGSLFLSELSPGINVYEVDLTCEGYKDNRPSIIVNYEKLNKSIPLTIDSVSIQDEKKGIILIEGNTKSGVNLICNMGITPNITEQGKYEMLIHLPQAVNEYIVEIIATDDDGNIGVAETKAQRKFYEDEYYKNAIEVEGSEFITNVTKYDSKVIKIKGELKSVQKLNDDLQVVEFIPSGVHDQSIIVYYYGDSSLKEESIRKFYGQYMGIQDGKILIHSYLVNK